jgi:hypothetical protein
VLDFAYHIHSKVGNQCTGGRINGRVVPIRYPLKSMAVYVLMAVLFYAVMQAVPQEWHIVLRLAINTVLICAFIGHIVYHDLPLKSLPVVGKYFR